MDRRGLEWEARGFGWLRSDLPQWREHVSAGEPSIRAMSLEGWPEETHLFIEYTYGGRTQTMDMDLWYGGYLNPPGPGQVGDDQMIATIGFSEFLENAMGVVSVPMPPTTYPDLDWEHKALEFVRLHLGLESLRDASWKDLRTMGVRGWPRETELFVAVESDGTPRTGSWPIWKHDAKLTPGEPLGDPETTAQSLLASILAL